MHQSARVQIARVFLYESLNFRRCGLRLFLKQRELRLRQYDVRVVGEETLIDIQQVSGIVSCAVLWNTSGAHSVPQGQFVGVLFQTGLMSANGRPISFCCR